METPASRLKFFPIALFGSVMGFAGFSLALQKATPVLNLPPALSLTFTLLSAVFFMLMTSLYLVKSTRFPQAVQKEFKNPVGAHFFGAFSISILLISLLFQDITPQAAQILWFVGVILHFGLTLVLLNTWLLNNPWHLGEMTPAWFLPAVGNIIIPLGTPMFADLETGWFFFSTGLIMWLTLLIIVFYRIFFHPPMPRILEPFLFIFIAPPAMGFLAYVMLNDGLVDNFARILYYIALFFAIFLVTQSPRLLKLPFAISWWALTFPLAAFANASWVMYFSLYSPVYQGLALLSMTMVLLLIGYLTFKTLQLVAQKKLCQPPVAPPPMHPIDPNEQNQPSD